MKIGFQASTLQKLCEDSKYSIRRLGSANAKKLQSRLEDMAAAENVFELVAGNPHPLQGDRIGQISISLTGGVRLVIEPINRVELINRQRSVDWLQVSSIVVCYVGDYHD